MKNIMKKCLIILSVYALLLFVVNISINKGNASSGDNSYRVSINRITNELIGFEKEKGHGADSLEELYAFSGNKYKFITGLKRIDNQISINEAYKDLDFEDNSQYELVMAGSNCYKINYKINQRMPGHVVFIVNICIILCATITIVSLLLIYFKKLRPFNRVSDLPIELAKGNLTIPLKEDKNKSFGKFIWGLDLLREKLEEDKRRELELQKEKKLLLMSLSHDIKTPLSAIKLYATALERNLYVDEEKRKAVACHIEDKVGEIEGFISDIMRASKEDFLNFDVNVTSCYSKDIIKTVSDYYNEKMQLNMIDFFVDFSKNNLIIADKDRFIEVIQNVIENALKYGDGKFIRIRTFREEDEYHFQILNSGCDLEERDVTSIFNSFFRGSNVKNKEGSGLGLYICRQLMHLMEGEIFAYIKEIEGSRCMLIDIIARVA